MSEREAFSAPSYRDKLDISQVFLRQIDRTNFSAATPGETYEEYVRQTMRLLPSQWQQWVKDQSDRYEKTEMVLIFRKNSGVRMGSQTHPALRDRTKEVLRLEDGTINWSDPNILSPTLQEKTSIDYEILNAVIGEAAELAGISWQTEKIAGDRGRDSIKREKTPYRRQRENEQEEISDSEGA